MKTAFSFGTWQYYPALEFLQESCKNYVDKFIAYKEPDLPTSFYVKHQKHFKDKRGFGYWIWKSYFINQLLQNANDDDIFLYIDSGNVVVNDITPIFDLCKNDSKGIILFDNRDGEPNGNVWKNNMFTRSDCFNILNLTEKQYVYGNQVDASYICFRKTDFTKNFFKLYQECCENYNAISDTANVMSPKIVDGFRDHRHDQSILSLLAIRYNISVYHEPSQWGNSTRPANYHYNQLFDHHRRRYYIG